jgi:hypothetical protein
VREVVDEVLELNTRTWRTLRLLARPGLLSRVHLGGRRAGQIRPFRLFLIASVVMLLAFSGARRYTVAYGDGSVDVGIQVRLDEGEAARMQARIDSLRQTGASLDTARAVVLEQVLSRRDDEATLNQFYFEWLTVPLALLVPLLALLLKGAFRDRLYAEHIVVSLHLHTAGFLTAALITGLVVAQHAWLGRPWLGAGLGIGGVALFLLYLVVAYRRIYDSSWGWALLAASGMGLVYTLALALLVVAYALLTFAVA